MKKSRLLITVIFCLVIIISCKKEVTNSTEPPVAPKIDRPIRVLQTKYSPDQTTMQKLIYTFPDTVPENKIEYDYLDSFFTTGINTFITRTHIEYDFDPVTKHLIKSSSRTAEMFNNDPRASNLTGNWDNTFDFHSHKDFPDTITTINYTDYLMTSQRPGFKFSLDWIFLDNGLILYDQNLNSTLSYQIILNDSGAVHLIDIGDLHRYPFNIAIPGFQFSPINSYKYFFDSADDCQRLLIQNGFEQQDYTLDTAYFQPTAELRSTFTYDNNSDEIKQLLGTVINAKDPYWNRIAVRYSENTTGKEPYYYFQRICRSYTDSLFTVSGNIYSLFSVTTYQNEIVRDQKGRIASLICKNGSDDLIEVFDFIYAN